MSRAKPTHDGAHGSDLLLGHLRGQVSNEPHYESVSTLSGCLTLPGLMCCLKSGNMCKFSPCCTASCVFVYSSSQATLLQAESVLGTKNTVPHPDAKRSQVAVPAHQIMVSYPNKLSFASKNYKVTFLARSLIILKKEKVESSHLGMEPRCRFCTNG